MDIRKHHILRNNTQNIIYIEIVGVVYFFIFKKEFIILNID